MAVYPSHGVGRIDSIEDRKVGEKVLSFYVLKILGSSMVIMIPTSTSDNVGLRTIISSGEASDVYKILKDQDVEIEPQPWNQRYRDYMGKIKTGSVNEIAAVLRDLYVLKESKTLSFGERKMMDTAKQLLTQELALADQMKEGEVEQTIEEIFS
ncbi:MAG: CarD family transcriptional regulator [Desulfobulbaceae bacterium]|nr:CarD family transcriptional regulator [Desulfobulbaceae bacterium]MCK5322610.1 CarD family transcriptional regulator [Desulfobulbaceae bacterium]MCK5437952.1 CarD family transcriptional regulator [Desulfobulbaceae bacterium]MCK5545357.1 CarD family transcriptional regulator [Desulfobulbaceae bacterium]